MGCTQSSDIETPQNKPHELPKKLVTHVNKIERSMSTSTDYVETENKNEKKENNKQNTEIKKEKIPTINKPLSNPIKVTETEINNLNESEKKPIRQLKKGSPSFIARTLRSFSVASNDSYRTATYNGHYYDVTSGLSNVELINTINWIEEFKPNIKEFQVLKEDALIEYKEKIRNQLSEYFTNINSKHDVGTATDRTMYTTIPEDHFAMIDTCANVVKDNLDSSHVKEIIVLSLQLLRDELRTLYDRLENEEFNINMLCAFANDYTRMKILCGNLNEDVHTYESDDITNDMFDIFINEMPNDYDRMINRLLEQIVQNVLADLDKVFFSKLFTKDWENSQIDANTLVVTLKDHFFDILVWLKKEHHQKIISMLLSETLSKYIFGLENRKKSRNENVVAIIAKVSKDKTIMKSYFAKICPPANEFDILNSICKLLLEKTK